jgi:signal transduction histidine kinase
VRAADSTITIIDGQSTYYLNGCGWSFYKTPQKATPVKEVIAHFKNGGFHPMHVPVLNQGIADQYYWLHFSLTNTSSTPERMVIDIQSPRINELILFERTGDSCRSLGTLGDMFPFELRKSLHKNFQYTVTIEKSARNDYFLYVNQVGHTLLLPIIIKKEHAFEQSVNRSYLTDGISYGLLLFVAIFSFLFFMNTRHNLYLYYGFYIITSIIWFLSFFGLGFEFIWCDYPGFNTIAAPLFASLNIFLNIQISQVLLNLRHSHYRIYQVGNIAKVLLLLVSFFPVAVNLDRYGYALNHAYLVCFLIVIVFSIVVVFTALLVAFLKGTIAARYYFFASILKTCSILNLALLELGIVPAMYYIEAFLQVGILIEIILLTYAIARRYTSYKLKTYQKVIRAQEKERDTIAKEIHDSISGTLTAVRYTLLSLLRSKALADSGLQEEISRISDTITSAQAEARNISHNLMPAYIKNNSLNRVIDLYITDLQQQTTQHGTAGIEIRLEANEIQAEFSEAVKLSIFRIVQEMMTNVLKHAQATAVNLQFIYRKNELTIIAEDNGIGMDPGIVTQLGGIGLRNIKSRVSLLNGTFLISSAQKGTGGSRHGTRILLRLPLTENAGGEDWDY